MESVASPRLAINVFTRKFQCLVDYFAKREGVKCLVREKNAEWAKFLRFYVYLCHVSDVTYFSFYQN